MFASRHVPATPSLSLERGALRMRTTFPQSLVLLTPKEQRAMTGSKTQASNTIWLAISFLAVAALASFAFAWHLAKDRCVVALIWLANGVAHKLMNFTKSLAAPPAPSELSSYIPIKGHHFVILTTIAASESSSGRPCFTVTLVSPLVQSPIRSQSSLLAGCSPRIQHSSTIAHEFMYVCFGRPSHGNSCSGDDVQQRCLEYTRSHYSTAVSMKSIISSLVASL